MDWVIFHALGVDWLKSAEADVKGEFTSFDSASANAIESFVREMESRGGSRDGASVFCENSLVTLTISGIVGAANIRRQRDVAEALDQFGNAVVPWCSIRRCCHGQKISGGAFRNLRGR